MKGSFEVGLATWRYPDSMVILLLPLFWYQK
jgi:hypothetical protein